jgi:hypothetical protein
MNIQDALSQYRDQIVGGLAGAAIGGGAVGLGTTQGQNETEEQFKNRRLQNALIGALSGGAAGAVGGGIYDSVSNAPEATQPGVLSKIKSVIGNSINPLTNLPAGITMGAGAGAGFGHWKYLNKLRDSMEQGGHSAFRRAQVANARMPRQLGGGLLGAAVGAAVPAVPSIIRSLSSQE